VVVRHTARRDEVFETVVARRRTPFKWVSGLGMGWAGRRCLQHRHGFEWRNE
jgi:hypothetical protein